MLPCSFQNIQGENVPAPFMTFEAAGFPPEILREVCSLHLSFSTCRSMDASSTFFSLVFLNVEIIDKVGH
jgi:hypothetical protein